MAEARPEPAHDSAKAPTDRISAPDRAARTRGVLGPDARQEWRRSWWVVVGPAIGIACGLSTWSFVASFFVEPLQNAFGWSRGQIGMAYYANVAGAILAPFLGRLVDRFGVRPILLTAMLLFGLHFIALANMTGSLTLYYGLNLSLVLVGMATSGLTFTRAVSSWFDASRGLALSASRLGLAAFGAIVPVLLYGAIARFGWQGGYYGMSALVLGIGLPISWLWVRDRRGDPASAAIARAAGNESSGTRLWIALLTNRRVLILCLASALTYAPLIGILSQLQPILREQGLDPATAAWLGGVPSIAILAATLLIAGLLDRLFAPLVGCLATLLPVLGCFLLTLDHPGVMVAGAAVILIGLAQGAEINIVAYMTARYFGMAAYATIYGLCVAAIGISSALGGVLFGKAYDYFGGYHQALLVSAGSFLVSALSYLAMGRYPEQPGLADGPRGSVVAPVSSAEEGVGAFSRR